MALPEKALKSMPRFYNRIIDGRIEEMATVASVVHHNLRGHNKNSGRGRPRRDASAFFRFLPARILIKRLLPLARSSLRKIGMKEIEVTEEALACMVAVRRTAINKVYRELE